MPSPAEARLVAKTTRRAWALVAPALFILAIAAIGPLLVVLIYSFLSPGEYGNVVWTFSFDGWTKVLVERDIFDDSLHFADANLAIFWRSISLSFVTTVLTFLAGFPTAWFIATRAPAARMVWLFLITVPFWTNLLIRTFAINQVIRNEGILNSILLGLGVIQTPLQMTYTEGALLIGMVYVYLPLMVLPLFAAMERFDFRLLEAGYDLYASRWQVLTRIVLPITRPGIVAGSILVFVPCLGAYVTPRILGGGKLMMLGNFIELQFGQGRDWPLGAALSIVLLVIVTLALLMYVRAVSGGRQNG